MTFDLRRPVETLHAHQFALLAAALALVLGLSLRAFLTSPLRRVGMRIEAEIALDFAAAEDDEDELDSSEEEGLDLAWRGVGLACGAALSSGDGGPRRGAACGPSGAGKSSLLRATAAARRGAAQRAPSRSAAASSAAAARDARVRRAGRLRAPAELTVAEHLLFHARLPARRRARERKNLPCGACPRWSPACAGTSRRAGRRRRGARRAAGLLGRRGARASVAAELLGAAALPWTSRRRALDARRAAARARSGASRRGGGGGRPAAVLCTLHQPRSEILALADRCCFIHAASSSGAARRPTCGLGGAARAGREPR